MFQTGTLELLVFCPLKTMPLVRAYFQALLGTLQLFLVYLTMYTAQ